MDEVHHVPIPTIRKLLSRLTTAVVAVLVLLLPACAGRPSELSAGDEAPDFTLSAATGEVVSLSDYTGSQPVLLYFHMAMG
jgi:hypothetical protein